MNILIINGSPRKKGLISQMLDIMQAEATQRGDRVEVVYTNDLVIKPCIGCMACISVVTSVIFVFIPLYIIIFHSMRLSHYY